MALPASGSISLGMVAAELGISPSGLSLGDTRVRALAIVPSGQIALSGLRGRRWVVRPSGCTYTGSAPSNPAYAYDGSGLDGLNVSTAAVYRSSNNLTSTQRYVFQGGAKSGTLQVALADVATTEDIAVSGEDTYTARSSVSVSLSLDGGTTYVNFDQPSSWSGADDPPAGNVLTKTLINQDLGNLLLLVTAASQRFGPSSALAIAPVDVSISDIGIF